MDKPFYEALMYVLNEETKKMTELEMKEWIDNSSYYDLLTKWRFAPIGDPFFYGDMCDYYKEVMARKREEHENPSAVSKAVGCDKR